MQSLRGNLANIPNALSNFITTNTNASSPIDGTSPIDCNILATQISQSMENDTQASVSGDDASDKSHAIPSSLIKEQWQLVLDQDATIDDLTNAIERCKELVLNTDECSNERKWLVRHLVELRFCLREMEDAANDQTKTGSPYKVNDGLQCFNCFISKKISCRLFWAIILLSTVPRQRQRADRTAITVPGLFGVSCKPRSFALIVVFVYITNV